MLFDCHTHSINSDGKNSVDEMCIRAIEKNLGGITITDHADMNFYNERATYQRIKNSLQDIEDARKKHSSSLAVLRGVELGEYTIAPKKAEELLSVGSFDAILCSVHYVPSAGWFSAYNRIDFRNNMTTDEEINEYIDCYFDLLTETVDSFDFDILAHIHCPVRYMTGKWGRKTDIMIFEDKICKIMEKIIKRNIALELNTVGLRGKDGNYNFSLDKILMLYRSLGGKMITLGSDAHTGDDVARDFDDALILSKECGFDRIYYFENRKPKYILI